MRLFSWAAAICTVLVALPLRSSAQSIYYVSIDTSGAQGSAGRLVFDITSNRPLTNRVDVINFATDGRTDIPETQGELVAGDLVQNQSPAKSTRLKAYGFFTELALPFAAFGTRINFVLNVSETGARDGTPPDEFSLFLLDHDGHPLGNTNRGDSEPIMSITITGDRGGKLDISRKGRRTATIGEPYEAHGDARSGEVALSGESRSGPTNRPTSGIAFNVTPGWTPDDPNFFQNASTFEGTLTEFCNRRCDGATICTGGAFGIAVDENTFYTFDDVSNLKAQVALVDNGRNPLGEGQLGRAKVVGVLTGSTLTIRDLNMY